MSTMRKIAKYAIALFAVAYVIEWALRRGWVWL
jgi:hypothetical protein